MPKIEIPPDLAYPEIVQTEQITRTVPDHEVLLRFTSDAHADYFGDWLIEQGWTAFRKYAAAAVADND